MKTFVFAILFTVTLMALGVAWKVHNYRECRAFGHSFLYCVVQK